MAEESPAEGGWWGSQDAGIQLGDQADGDRFQGFPSAGQLLVARGLAHDHLL